MDLKRLPSWARKQCFRIVILVAVFCLVGQARRGFSQNPVWTQTSAPNAPWRSLAVSADGSRIFAVAGGSQGPYPQIVGPIYVSTNSGVTWDVTTAPVASWNGVACSADGARVAAVIAFGAIYTSTNFGATWTATTAPIASWQSIASSSDGMMLIAGEGCIWPPCDSSTAAVYRSADGGASWHYSAGLGAHSVASSADGSHLAAAWGGVIISTNAGASWTASGVSAQAIASSWDGRKLVAANSYSAIRISGDGGSTWTQSSSPGYLWWSVCSSADGSTLLAGISYGSASIYSSVDSGNTWVSNSAPSGVQWKALGSSADGKKLFAAVNGGGIYTYQIAPALTVTSSDHECVVSWPASATRFALQRNSGLEPTNWTTLTNAPTSDAIRRAVTIPETGAAMFFRLIEQ